MPPILPTPRIPLLPPRGDYRTLRSYQKAEVIYDITFRFCHRFLNKGDRTIDQMVQAARSGKQNIVEGSKVAVTSKEMEIKLTNVARASLEELLTDYRDFLRVRDLAIWHKDCREAGLCGPIIFSTASSPSLERAFPKEGGLRERMTRARLESCAQQRR